MTTRTSRGGGCRRGARRGERGVAAADDGGEAHVSRWRLRTTGATWAARRGRWKRRRLRMTSPSARGGGCRRSGRREQLQTAAGDVPVDVAGARRRQEATGPTNDEEADSRLRLATKGAPWGARNVSRNGRGRRLTTRELLPTTAATWRARGGGCRRRGRRAERDAAAGDGTGSCGSGTGDGAPETSQHRGTRTPSDRRSKSTAPGASPAELADATECSASVGAVGRHRRRCKETLQK
jgi:hypothetical protein